MEGAGGSKKAKYNEVDLLILDILQKDNPTVEPLDGNESFQAEDTAADQHQMQLPQSVLPADIPPPSSVRDAKRKGGTEFLSEQIMISFRIHNHFTVLGSHKLLPWDFSVDVVGCA
jgi:hypothetical protein